MVAENIAAGAPIATVTVNDDPGDTHTFIVSDPRFVIVGGTLQLAPGARLDDSDVGLLPLTINVTDNDGNSVDFPIALVVNNVNEAPDALALSNARVAENALGATVGLLSVYDQDLGDVHTITVSDSRFEVVGGALRLKAGVSLNCRGRAVDRPDDHGDRSGRVVEEHDPYDRGAGRCRYRGNVTGTAAANTLTGTPGNDVYPGAWRQRSADWRGR